MVSQGAIPLLVGQVGGQAIVRNEGSFCINSHCTMQGKGTTRVKSKTGEQKGNVSLNRNLAIKHCEKTILKNISFQWIALGKLWLQDIELGKPSDWVRETVDLNYEAWLPDLLVQGRNKVSRLPGGNPRGHAPRGGHSMPECSSVTTWIECAFCTR